MNCTTEVLTAAYSLWISRNRKDTGNAVYMSVADANKMAVGREAELSAAHLEQLVAEVQAR